MFGWHADKAEMASIRADGTDLKILGIGHAPLHRARLHDDCLHRRMSRRSERLHDESRRRGEAADSVASEPVGAVFLAWSPDGKRIAYEFKTAEALEIFTCAVNGTHRVASASFYVAVENRPAQRR